MLKSTFGVFYLHLTEILRGKWEALEPDIYLDTTRDNTGVIWLGRRCFVHVNGTMVANFGLPNEELKAIMGLYALKTWQCTIESSSEWNQFATSSYLVRYKNDKDWKCPNAENEILQEFAIRKEQDAEFIRRIDPQTHNAEEFKTDAIITAFDSKLCKRVIVDGIHRAVIMTNENRTGKRTPHARIYECVGETVDRLFPPDFGHFK